MEQQAKYKLNEILTLETYVEFGEKRFNEGTKIKIVSVDDEYTPCKYNIEFEEGFIRQLDEEQLEYAVDYERKSNELVYVNVYEVTRHFGGHEEGGWYYNWDECIECVPVKEKNSHEMKELLEKENESLKYGNIYSVLGGRDIEVRIESRRCQSQTHGRPMYE